MKLRGRKFTASVFIAFISLFFFSNTTFAQQPAPGPFDPQPNSSTFGNFEVGLPGNGPFAAGKSIDSFISGAQSKPILTLVNLTVTFLTAILVIVGVITIVLGGYLYMTAAGNGSQVEKAKEMIKASLIGILIAFISVVLLNTINPALGPKAGEPTLPSPSGSPGAIIKSSLGPDSFGTGGGASNGGGGSGAGSGTSNTNGSTTNTTGGGSTGSNQTLFGNNIKASSSQSVSVVIDDRNYYIRDASGFDRPSTLEEVVSLTQSAPGDDNGIGLRIYETLNARAGTEDALRNALTNATIPDSKTLWVPLNPAQQ